MVTIATYLLATLLIAMALGVVFVIGRQDGKIYKLTTALYAGVFIASAWLLIYQERVQANQPTIADYCFEEEELEPGQPMMGMNGVMATFYQREDGGVGVVRICD